MDTTLDPDLRAYSKAVGRRVTAKEASFHPTPAKATWALLEKVYFSSEIREPACGDGAMADVFKNAGHTVIASDKYDWGYGKTGVDWLKVEGEWENVVTNPPYNRRVLLPFIERSIINATSKCAMLLPLTFLETHARKVFFERYPADRILVFSYRVLIHRFEYEGKKLKSGVKAYCWIVWDKRRARMRLEHL